MTKAVQRRRGTTAEHATFTGALGEITVDTTKDAIILHDGVLVGGFPHVTIANLLPDLDTALGTTPIADKILFFDFTANTYKYLNIGTNLTIADTTLNAAVAIGINKNLFNNADVNSWLEGTSFAAIANLTYFADVYQYSKVGTMVHTVSRSTNVPTVALSGHLSNYSILVDCTTADVSIAAGDVCTILQPIEGYNFLTIAQIPFVFRFKHAHTKTGIYCVSFRNIGTDRSYVVEYTQSVADAWEIATVFVSASPVAGTWDYTNGVGLFVAFCLVSGSAFQTTADAWQTGNFVATSNQVNACDNVANNFRIAQMQPEKGNVATDFESEFIQPTYQKIRRYFNYYDLSNVERISLAYADTTTTAKFMLYLPTGMRTIPTISETNLSLNGIDITSILVEGVSNDNQTIFIGVTVGSGLTAGNMYQVYSVGDGNVVLKARL